MLEATPRNDRRRYLRVVPSMSNPIVGDIQVNGMEFNNVDVRDISLGGVAVAIPDSEFHANLGTHVLNMNFSLPELGTITASGVVRRFQDASETEEKPVCALEFTKVPTSSDRVLFQYINGRQRELSWFSKPN